MLDIFKKLLNNNNNCSKVNNSADVITDEVQTSYLHSERNRKLEKGAKDFALRFEDVMRELSNG